MNWVDVRAADAGAQEPRRTRLAEDVSEIAELVEMCRAGRIYGVEAWVRSGRPIQAPGPIRGQRWKLTPGRAATETGQYDLLKLLLVNGYDPDLEWASLFDIALHSRRDDLVDLLFAYGADPLRASAWAVVSTYDGTVITRFWNSGLDLGSDPDVLEALASTTSNRPLYGFFKRNCVVDATLQRGLDIALGAALTSSNDKAVHMCIWAGASPRRSAPDLRDVDKNDDEVLCLTAFERAVLTKQDRYLELLKLDPATDDIQGLYSIVWDFYTLRTLVEMQPPADWNGVASFLLSRFVAPFGHRSSLGSWELRSLLELGAKFTCLDRSTVRTLRQALLSAREDEARRVVRLLANPDHMDPDLFIRLLAHKDSAALFSHLQPALLLHIADRKGVPPIARRVVRKLLDKQAGQRRAARLSKPETKTHRWATRQELYDLVWSMPMTTVAARRGISNTAVKKLCARNTVPVPPRGYWQKVEHGHRVVRPPLRLAANDVDDAVWLRREVSSEA